MDEIIRARTELIKNNKDLSVSSKSLTLKENIENIVASLDAISSQLHLASLDTSCSSCIAKQSSLFGQIVAAQTILEAVSMELEMDGDPCH